MNGFNVTFVGSRNFCYSMFDTKEFTVVLEACFSIFLILNDCVCGSSSICRADLDKLIAILR